MGNTNFSVITPRALFTRHGGAELVVRDRLNVPSCTVNERNDVVLRPDGTKEGELKVRPRRAG
jgi:lipoate-protein ligase A